MMDELLKDARFVHVAKDPKYRRIPKAERKVKIDKRFQGMFKDKKFSVKFTTDKRGRPVNQSTTENLRKYYDLSSSEGDSASDEDTSASSTIGVRADKTKVKGTESKTQSKTKDIQSDSGKEPSTDEEESQQSDNGSSSQRSDLVLIKSQGRRILYPKGHFEDDVSSKKDSSEADLEANDRQLHKKRTGDDGKLTNEIKEKLKNLNVDYARGEGVLLTDSSSDESSETSDEEEEVEHKWGELDKEAEITDEITRRLAICNMDWDRIRAVDLMILLNSFLPSGGLIRSVTIYPSEYGQQRMKEENVSGPQELIHENVKDEDENDENNEGAKYHMEKLRQYQLNRLKYYYAVAEFDSSETANKVYAECDGIEYESTATRMDLRFIPDDMTFDQELKETCEEIPELTKYQPRQFTTTALQQVKVALTWDETNLDRQEFTQKVKSGNLANVNDADLQTYLASASEDDSDVEKDERKNITEDNSTVEPESNIDPIMKYKSLLRTIEEEEEAKKNNDVELEFTWGLRTKEKVDKLIEEKMKKKEELTPFEQYLEKRKSKINAKREERRKLKDKDNESDSEDSLPEGIDMNDRYFSEELEGKKPVSQKKKKRRNEREDVESPCEQEESQNKAELELLLMDKDDDVGKKHFNMKKIEENATLSKSKRKRLNKKKIVEDEGKTDDFEVDVKDPRFAALFTSHHFNIDPANPHYRSTKGTEALISEKLKRRADNDDTCPKDDKKAKKPRNEKLPTELQALVRSVKQKSQNIAKPIKR